MWLLQPLQRFSLIDYSNGPQKRNKSENWVGTKSTTNAPPTNRQKDRFHVKIGFLFRGRNVPKINEIPKITKNCHKDVPTKSLKVMPRTSQSQENTSRNLSKCFQIGSHWIQQLQLYNPQTLSNDVHQEMKTDSKLQCIEMARWRVMRAAHWIYMDI